MTICCHHMSYSFRLAARLFFYMHRPTDMIAHAMAFITSVVDYWLKREINQWVHHKGSIRWPIVHCEPISERSYHGPTSHSLRNHSLALYNFMSMLVTHVKPNFTDVNTIPIRQDSTYHGLCYTSNDWNEKQLNGSTMKDRSDDPSHNERTLLPRNYYDYERINISTL